MAKADAKPDNDNGVAGNVWSVGLAGRCPRCGDGKLFHQLLNLRPRCEKCGLDFSFADAGDGPAIFVMFVLGAIMVGVALFVELTYSPPLWLHAVLWLPVTMLLAIVLLRPMKGVLIALQYRNKAEQGRLENGAPAHHRED